jgi:hypothetical protein
MEPAAKVCQDQDTHGLLVRCELQVCHFVTFGDTHTPLAFVTMRHQTEPEFYVSCYGFYCVFWSDVDLFRNKNKLI